jgi:hypothetical protein
MSHDPDLVRLHLGSRLLERLRADGLLRTAPQLLGGGEYLPLGRLGFGLLGFADVPVSLVPDDPEAVLAEYADGTVEALEDRSEQEAGG